MRKNNNRDCRSQKAKSIPRRALWAIVGASVLTIAIGLLHARRHAEPLSSRTAKDASTAAGAKVLANYPARSAARRSSAAPALSAEEIVASKVSQFARSRREIARGIGRRSNKTVPPEVEKFFDAIEAGQWEEIKAQWDVLAPRSGQYENATNHWDELDPFWPAVLDAYGVAEQAHLWPAQKLLDYGNAILGSLRPGMVYVGGTDDGRWIPELLNDTGDGEQHIIVTQNALADARYLDFVNTLYSDRMTPLTSEDSQAAFQGYVADAQKRLEHDQQFPDEPKQVRPGEDIRVVDGKVQVSGMVAVMGINEKLLQTLMQKNPDLSFAVQESISMKGTYSDALPLGPLMELGARDQQNDFTAERATQSLQYWQDMAQQVLANPEGADSSAAQRSYSHDTAAAANLLAAHNFVGQAEQAYRLAQQLWPENPESVSGLADLLVGSGRESEARQLLADFSRQYPDHQKDLERMSAAWRLLVSAQTTTR
jgi:hypothetical protein